METYLKKKKNYSKARRLKGKAGQKLSILPLPNNNNNNNKSLHTAEVWLKPQKLPEGGKAFFSPEATSVGPAFSPALGKRRQFMAQGTTLK